MEESEAQKMISKFTPAFRVVRELGSGNFGTVYLVEDTHQRQAVKIVRLEAGSSVRGGSVHPAQEKIERDWAVVCKHYDELNHPRIVKVTLKHRYPPPGEKSADDGKAGHKAVAYGLIYMDYHPWNLHEYVMERIQGKRYGVTERWRLGLELVTLMYRLRQETGFLMTDMKPSNVLVREDAQGNPVLLAGDLGGLKHLGTLSRRAMESTGEYWSPEVRRGELDPDEELEDEEYRRRLEHALVYSLGLVLFFVMEGRLPYEEKNFAARNREILSRGKPDWSGDHTGLEPLVHVVEECLKGREERLESFEAVWEKLQPKSAEDDTFQPVDLVQEAGPSPREQELEERLRQAEARLRQAEEQERVASSSKVEGEEDLDSFFTEILQLLEDDLPPPKSEPAAGTEWTEPTTGMKFVWIPTGEFWMGQSEGETRELIKAAGQETYDKYFKPELPRHRVALDGFWLGKYPVTLEEFRKFVQASSHVTTAERLGSSLEWNGMEWKDVKGACWNNVRRFRQGEDHPVVHVSWEDGQAMAQWMSSLGGGRFALPTEAQWEYGCRAGTTTPFWCGETISTDQANYDGNYVYGSGRKGGYRQSTTPVDQFKPNRWGLHDMHGNVLEWCEDWYQEDFYSTQEARERNPVCKNNASGYRVLRGGSWGYNPRWVRAADRHGYAPVGRLVINGFRLVRLPQD